VSVVSGAAVLLVLLILWIALSVPGYVVGQRRKVNHAGVAFVPFVGPTIVMLWSMDRSGWMCLIGAIPLVGFIWAIWFAISMPQHHGRTGWWALAFLFLPVIGYYLYAFTLETEGTAAPALQ
jgi:hypothetical protein